MPLEYDVYPKQLQIKVQEYNKVLTWSLNSFLILGNVLPSVIITLLN